MPATRLAVREARRRVGLGLPLHLVGFSNGGALAVKYTLDSLEDPQLSRPDRLVLISPMIGISTFAQFAGIAGWPAIFPAFAKAAWLSVVPEFNPFKYNSFPVNGARQSHRLTVALQGQIIRLARQNGLTGLPPVLTFQSVMDFTVSTRAVFESLYGNLPANADLSVNQSELVLFDINRSAKAGVLFRLTSETMLTRLLPAPPRPYRTTIVTNCRRRQPGRGGARYRGRCDGGKNNRSGAGLSAGRVFAVACRLTVSAYRRAVRAAAGPGREFRRGARLDRHQGRGRRAGRQSRLAAADVIQPVLPVHDEPHRGRLPDAEIVCGNHLSPRRDPV
jgi:hypothetical protein